MSLHKNFSTLTSFAHECGHLVVYMFFFFAMPLVYTFCVIIVRIECCSGQKSYGCL